MRPIGERSVDPQPSFRQMTLSDEDRKQRFDDGAYTVRLVRRQRAQNCLANVWKVRGELGDGCHLLRPQKLRRAPVRDRDEVRGMLRFKLLVLGAPHSTCGVLPNRLELIGGCCRIGPEHISAMRSALRRPTVSSSSDE